MSQLDLTISFNQIIGFLFCFSLFSFYFVNILYRFYYNNYIRNQIVKQDLGKKVLNNNQIIKKILSL